MSGNINAAAVALTMLVVSICAAAEPPEIPWEQEFYFGALPNELDAAWKPLGQGETVIEDDLMRIKSETGGACYFVTSALDSIWNVEVPTTVEFRVRAPDVDTGAEAAAHIIFKTNETAFVYNITNTEFKTFRAVIEDETVYVVDLDDPSNAVLLTPERLEREIHPDSVLYPNSIGFGDYSSMIGGTSEWEFVRWTHSGAFWPADSE